MNDLKVDLAERPYEIACVADAWMLRTLPAYAAAIRTRPFNCLGCLFVRTVGCFRFGTKMEVNMHWRITVEAVDPTGEEYRKEFLVEKNLDELTDGRIGFSIDDGKMVMAEIQKAVVQRELDLWVRYRRVCQSCGGQLPIKDYQKRNIITVFGSVPVTWPSTHEVG